MKVRLHDLDGILNPLRFRFFLYVLLFFALCGISLIHKSYQQILQIGRLYSFLNWIRII